VIDALACVGASMNNELTAQIVPFDSVKPKLSQQAEISGPPNFNFEIVRTFQDATDMFIQTSHSPCDDQKQWVTMSLTRMKNDGGTSVRHQVTSIVRAQNASRNCVSGGMRDICDLDQTEANKKIVSEFVESILVKKQVERLGAFMPWGRFVGHNPLMGKGRRGFAEFIEAETSREKPMKYHGVEDLVGKGNFVAVFGNVSFRGKAYKAADLFRLDKGQILEHWDVAEQLDEI